MSASNTIALDWGTSSFRAYLVGPDGTLFDSRASAEGILSVPDGAFEPVFERLVAGWDVSLPVLASGMITSRQGWREVPYATAPAGLGELADGVDRFRTISGRTIVFVPGIAYRAGNGVPDVMRGEETQIVGLAGNGSGLYVTRGTHCKWVGVERGQIVRFATFMTGELFAVLKSHSILGRLMTGEATGGPGFARGVADGLADGAMLLHALFGARTLGLFGDLQGDELAAYLSGLLTGAEIVGGRQLFAPSAEDVTVIGAPSLAEPFCSALNIAGIPSRLGAADAAVRGLMLIGKHVGVIA